jgi:hypothetical protein
MPCNQQPDTHIDALFPLYLWDLLLPQAELTINLMRQLAVNPKLCAWEFCNGPFDFNKTPLAPMGCRVLIHAKATMAIMGFLRKTWILHRTIYRPLLVLQAHQVGYKVEGNFRHVRIPPRIPHSTSSHSSRQDHKRTPGHGGGIKRHTTTSLNLPIGSNQVTPDPLQFVEKISPARPGRTSLGQADNKNTHATAGMTPTNYSTACTTSTAAPGISTNK